jgi:hypothetical protein
MVYIFLVLASILLIIGFVLYHIGKHYKKQQKIVQDKYNRKPTTAKKKRPTGSAYRDFKK